MEDAINHDCRRAEGMEMCLLGSNKGTEGKEASYGRGAPARKGHQFPVKATEGKISPSLFVLLVFLHMPFSSIILERIYFRFLNFFLLESNLYEFFFQHGCHSGEKER